MRARLALLIAIVALLLGCARDPVTLVTTWTFESDAGATHPVVLPTHLSLPDRPLRYRLRAKVSLAPELRGRTLTLAFARLPAIATLRANGHDLVALDADVTTVYRVSGAQRWSIPAELARNESLDLELSLDHRFTQSAWIDCVPRLSPTDHGDAQFLAIHAFNEATAYFGLAVVFIAGFSYFLVWLLDRRRTAHGWFALEAAGGIAFPAFASGFTQPILGTADSVVMGAQVALGAICAASFVHAYYGLPFPGRKLLVAWGALVVWGIATAGPFSTTRLFAPVVAVIVAVSAWYQIWLLVRLLRTSPRPRNVWLVASAWPVAGLLGTMELAWWLGLGAPFQGLQGGSAAITLVAFMRIAALSREHLRSLRKADRLNEELAARIELLEAQKREVQRLNEELRRQIASRSAQLADALARIGARHSGVVLLDIGDTVAGRYRVVRPIASGGMGSVYEAVRMNDAAPFALKVLHGKNEPMALARFAREAQIAAQIDHPNVVSLVDMDVDSEGFVFLVMELVRGTPLSELRDRYGDLAFVVPVLRQIAEGLDAIHERGIVHRDLKPANVLIVDPDGAPRAKITDFGIAMLGDRDLPVSALPPASLDATTVDDAASVPTADEEATAVEARRSARGGEPRAVTPSGSPRPASTPSRPSGSPRPSSTPLTRTGVVMGTPLYMAPELIGGARHAKPAADVFSFGVLAFLLLSGEHPFPERRTTLEIREAPPLRVAGAPSPIVEAIESCLRIDPGARPTARALAEALVLPAQARAAS